MTRPPSQLKIVRYSVTIIKAVFANRVEDIKRRVAIGTPSILDLRQSINAVPDVQHCEEDWESPEGTFLQ